MSKEKVKRGKNGKYKIKGKENKSLELTLDTSDYDNFEVYEMSGDEMNSKLPAANPLGIRWFACFSIHDKKKGGDASVPYSFDVSLEKDQRYFIAYANADGVNVAYDVTDQIKNGKLTLDKGDPASGTVP